MTIVKHFIGLLLCAPLWAQAQGKLPLTQEPMYGGADRSAVLQLKLDDERMVREVTQWYGTRQKASAALVGSGFAFYQKDDLVNAMNRFNLAWTVDADNPDVYVGFAAVLNDRNRHCDAMAMMDMALARAPATTRGIYADAARAVASCALTGTDQAAADNARLLERAEALFRQAEALEANKGYVYASWATVHTWRRQYAEAWRLVDKARAAGSEPDAAILAILKDNMPARAATP